MTVVVKKADARWRRAALADDKPTRKGERLAIITAHHDGTFCMRLRGFDSTALAAVKAAPAERMTWTGSHWIIWSRHDRHLVIERLQMLGFRVVLRGVS